MVVIYLVYCFRYVDKTQTDNFYLCHSCWLDIFTQEMDNNQLIFSSIGVFITIATIVVSHFRTVANLKEKIHTLDKELEKLKGRDDLQQQVIDQIGKQIDILMPQLLEAVKNKSNGRK